MVNHPNCRDFVAERLCRYLITDEPTKEMKQPIIDAFKKSDGFLPEIHKAAIKVAFEYNDKYKKFQMLNYLMSKLFSNEEIELYETLT